MYKRILRLAKLLGVEILFVDGFPDENIPEGFKLEGRCSPDCKSIEVLKSLKELDPMKLEHVLIHELIHVTGAEHHLARPSLRWYFEGEIYAKGEEQIAEGGCYALEKAWGAENLGFYKDWVLAAIERHDHPDLDFDEDIIPEIDRAMQYIHNLELEYEQGKKV